MANSDAPLTFIVPGNPEQRTGGYAYVRALVAMLEARGWKVTIEGLAGRFPVADDTGRQAMGACLAALPDGAIAVIDGLALGGVPDAVAPHAARLRLVALVHHPLALENGLDDATQNQLFQSEQAALALMERVITTSQPTASALADYAVPMERVHVVMPGTHPVTRAPAPLPERDGTLRLLCIGHLSPRKGQDLLIDALAPLAGGNWHLTLAGSGDRDPVFAAELRHRIEAYGLTSQVTLVGEQDDAGLATLWRAADGLVLASRYEGYGMVIDEALAAGRPVLSSDGGALAETARRPGIRLHPAGEVGTLTAQIRDWLTDPEALRRQTLDARAAARTLRTWATAAAEFENALTALCLPDAAGTGFEPDWLALRESADHAARHHPLTDLLYQHLPRGPLNIVDLGSGTGSNLRYLAPRLATPQSWLLVEPDQALIEAAPVPDPTPGITLRWHRQRVTADNLEALIPDDTNLLTGAALLDLMGPGWLEALAQAAARRRCALLMALSYDGHFELDPPEPADEWLRATVNDHQHRDKGNGGAAGPDAVPVLSAALQRHGFRVHTEPSPWQLTAPDRALQKALMTGWCDAAREQAPEHGTGIDDWLARRLAQAERGELGIRVGHRDLLALPPRESG